MIFNNFEVVTKGWYVAYPSRSLLRLQIKSINLCGQQIVLYRGVDGVVRALDAYCPHLGTDLGLGKVCDNFIRCFFHHWSFDGEGNCVDIPCQSDIPNLAHTRGYATYEKYGFIWVYPEAIAPYSVPEFDELRGKEVMVVSDYPLYRNCHHHICMMNGIDAQHLQTVHHLSINMTLDLRYDPDKNMLDFTLTGLIPRTTWREKVIYGLLGDRYQYTMRYADGCVGLLTIMKNVKLLPPLYMIYAYRPEGEKAYVQPIYITAKRAKIWGWLWSYVLLLLTRLAYYFLRGEDGKIYDNIRYNPRTLLKIDAPLINYMNYVNRLSPSIWSKKV